MNFIAVDALPRSGTTLLASLLGSQKNFTATAGVLMEPFAYYKGEVWPMSYLQRSVITENDPAPITNIEQFKAAEFASIKNDFEHRSCGLSLEEWQSIFDQIKSYDDLDAAYIKLASLKNNSENIVLRWNNTLFYSRPWTSRPNHYWIAMIRDPRDRACSRYATHTTFALDEIVLETLYYYNQLDDAINDKNLMVVYYEDLVKNPGKTITQIGDFVGAEIKTPNLTSIKNAGNNQGYRNQGWRARVKHGDHKIGTNYEGVHSNSIGQWKESQMVFKPNLQPYYYGLEEIIGHFDFLERYRDV